MSGYAIQKKAAVIVSSRGTLNTNKHNNKFITYLVYKLSVLTTYMYQCFICYLCELSQVYLVD